MKKYWLFYLLFVALAAQGQKDTAQPVLDILHYRFQLQLNDDNNTIKGIASVIIHFLQTPASFDLDMVKKNSSGKGMTVTAVQQNNSAVSFLQEAEYIHIYTNARQGDTVNFTINYEGVPATGLIIDKNKYGHRTFFADNWPNRAHHWLPCVDHPADKAAVDFIITAPDHYQIIGNGIQVEETNLPNHLKQTHWQETVPLPTKVMAIGAADFAVNLAGEVDCIPVHSWVYPEDKGNGFYDYALAKDILPWFIKNVGAYAFKKLANVQSKTQFGGMENASAIFYAERTVTGDRSVEALLTHEIAHQWFGNSATEASWPHVWLSEGFASYMTHLYLEQKYGIDSLQQRLRDDRETVIAFSKKRFTPIVDSSVSGDYFPLLNANSYKKGAWVLHMLRRQLGNAVFWQGIRNYYAQYAGKNATTANFRTVMETTSTQNLQTFFQQWLHTAGHPVLTTQWQYNKTKKVLLLTVTQTQPGVFQFPLQVAIKSAGGEMLQTFMIKDQTTVAEIALSAKPVKIIVDPNVNLLFEGTVAETK